MPFEFKRLEIPDVVLVIPKVFGDERGFFMETFKKSDFEKFGIKGDWVQDNHSRSKKGVLRGLHYQLNPKAQGKLVRVVRGAVFDVAVDIRKGSPWYGKWVGVILSEENKYMLWVPPGFAHGVAVLEDDTELLYKVSGAEYSPEHDRAIRWDDPEIGIIWPIREPILSEKDKNAPFLKDAENNFIYEGGK
jgi:dTDP-4-dehydrorhamnose 3,5-epimerase